MSRNNDDWRPVTPAAGFPEIDQGAKLHIQTRHAGYGKQYVEPIDEYVVRMLDGDEYGAGRLEAAERTATNACAALGRLLEWMAGRGMIDAPTMSRIAADYMADDEAEFVQSNKVLDT